MSETWGMQKAAERIVKIGRDEIMNRIHSLNDKMIFCKVFIQDPIEGGQLQGSRMCSRISSRISRLV